MANIETPYHTLLGKKRIKDVCKDGGLTPKDDLLVDQILLSLHLEGGEYKNIKEQVNESLKWNPRERLIIKVMILILDEVGKKMIK